jgi:hypothetical protein
MKADISSCIQWPVLTLPYIASNDTDTAPSAFTGQINPYKPLKALCLFIHLPCLLMQLFLLSLQ